jgi:hypothetical protein
MFDNGIIPSELIGNYPSESSPILPPTKDLDLLDVINTASSSGPVYQPSASSSSSIVDDRLNSFINKGASGASLASPTFFDYDRSQVERYTSNTRDFNALGYVPSLGAENEYRYARLQTWGDVWSNGLTGMFKLAGNTFVEGWKGWGNIVDAFASTSWDEAKTDLMGSTEDLLEQDKITKGIMNKYAIYNLPEYDEGILNRKFFGDMLQQSGFALGTIAQFLSEELITLGLSTEFSLAKLGISAPKWAGRIVTKADVAKDMVKLGTPIWKSAAIPEFLVTGARKLIPFADTGYTMAKYGKAGAGALQLGAIGLGGVRRFLSEANMAFTEARMEAAGTYGELYNKLYDEELFKTGEAPTADNLARMEKLAKDAAYDNFKVNTGILMLSNRLQFDNLFTKFSFGRKVLGEGVSEFAEDVLEVSGKRLVKEGAKEGVKESFTKGYQKGALGALGLFPEIAKDFGVKKAAWIATKSVGKNVFKWEASEGLQELFQEGSNKGLSSYYYDLYHGKTGYSSKMEAIFKNIDNPVTDMQGMKTFLMGALTGRLLSPINFTVGKIKDYAATNSTERLERRNKIASTLEVVNAFYENPNSFLPEHIANVKVQSKVAENMQEAIANRDAYVFHNNKDSGFAKMISAAIKTDMIDGVIETLRGYGEAFNDNEFKEAFGFDKTEENVASTKDFFNKIADNVVDFHKTWRDLKNRYGDLVIPEIYKEGTPGRKTALRAKRALDEAIEMLATVDYKARKSTMRAGELQVKMSELPVLGATVATAFRNIGVIQNTEKEIELLKTEIENLESQEKKDKATKQLLKAKKDQLKSLEAWNENYAQLNNMTRGNKRKSKKARAALKNYLNAKNQESNVDTVIKENELESIYENLLDYIELNKDNKDYIDAYNVLANPIKFVQVHQKILDAMDAVEEEKLLEHISEVLKQQAGKSQPPPEKPLGPEEAPELETYLRDSYEGQLAAGNTDLSYEDWLKGPTVNIFLNLYNKRWNTNYTIDNIGNVKSSTVSSLKELKDQVEQTEYLGSQFLESVFNNLAKILNISSEEVGKLYEQYMQSIPEEELKAELIKLGIEQQGAVASEEDVINIYNKYVLPKFISSLISENETPGSQESLLNEDDFEIIPQPARKTKLSKPAIIDGEKLLDDGIEGMFIIQYANNSFGVINSDGQHPFGQDSEIGNLVLSKQEAFDLRNEMLKMRKEREKKESSFFKFGGLNLKVGLVLVNKETGKKFMVVSKGEPFVPKDKEGNPKLDEDGKPLPPTVKLKKLQGSTIVNDFVYLNEDQIKDYSVSLKTERLSEGKIVPKNLSRLKRVNELNRIFPHQKTVDGVRETKDQAQKRLDGFLSNIPQDTLNKGLSIRIKKNTGDRKGTPVNMGQDKRTNPFLYRYNQQYQIQILFNGEPIGYLTNYNDLQYINEAGLNVPMQNLTLDQFRMIFDVDGKSIETAFAAFKKAYNHSYNIMFALKKLMEGKTGEVEITNEQLSKLLVLSTTGGEFNYVDEEKNEVGAKLNELDHSTINGFYYIIDRSRRYGKGYNFEVVASAKTNAEGADRKKIEAEIKEARKKGVDPLEQLGRYVAVVKMPNGVIRFVELKTDQVSDEFLNDLINQINERAKLTKQNNIEEGRNEKNEKIVRRKSFDYNEELNTFIANNLFISVPLSQKGTYVTIGVSDVGDLVLEFHKKVGEKDIREKIYLYGKNKEEAVNIESIDDLISLINSKIDAKDKTARKEEYKIGFHLKRENFKVSVPDSLEDSDLMKLRTDVRPSIVKNVPLNATSLLDVPAPEITPAGGIQQKPPTNTQGEQQVDQETLKAQREALASEKVASEKEQETPETLTGVDALKKKVKDLEKEKAEQRAIEEAKLRAENPNERAAFIMRSARKIVDDKYDDLIEKAKNELNQAYKANNRGRVLKVTTPQPQFDKKSIVKINEFRKYISRILGDVVSVEQVKILGDNLKDGNITVGQFIAYLEQAGSGAPKVKGKIQVVGEDSPFKYHEAFHAIFRLMLTDNQISRFLSLAKVEVKKKLAQEGKTLASELKSMRELHTLYSEMTDAELEERYYEEYLADKFDDWKLNNNTPTVIPGFKNFFKWLWEIITRLFKNTSKDEIQSLFLDIDRGKYKNSRVRENRFTKPDALSVTEPVLKAIQVGTQSVEDENGTYVTIPKYLPQQEGDKLASTVASIFHNRVLSAPAGYNKSKLLSDILDDFFDLYNPDREFYIDQIENLYQIDPAQAESFDRKLAERFEVFASEKNRKTLADAVDVHLRIMGYQQSLEDEEYTSMEEEFGSRYSTDNWREAHSIGGFGSLSSALRKYIASTVYKVDNDEFGNTQFLDGEPLIESVNANLVYNGVLKAVANTTDQNKFVARLYELSNTNSETAKFLNKFFYDTGLIYDEVNNNFMVTNPKQGTLFQMVVKGFQQYTVDYIFINKDIRQSKKKTIAMLANRMGSVKAQFSQWQNAFSSVYFSKLLTLKTKEERKEFAEEQTGFLQDFITNLNPATPITSERLDQVSQELSDAFKTNLGISLSPLFIKFSIASAKELKTDEQLRFVERYGEVEAVDIESIKEISKSLRALEDPFSKNIDSLKEKEVNLESEGENTEDVDGMGEGGNIGRLTKLAKGNGIFDETVSTTSYKNAEGQLVYSHQLPTFHLVKVNSLNNESSLDEIKQDEFLRQNMLLSSDEFTSLLQEGNFRVERIDGMKSSVLSEDKEGNLR